MEDDQEQQRHSLLPYEDWIENALRQVVVQAIEHAVMHGLPGGHHFYLTFRTDHPGVVVPQRLRAQYPQEMTIVLQHQYWDLKMDREAGIISVGLSFGGVPSILVIPLDAVVAFTDPQVRYGLRFRAKTWELPPTPMRAPPREVTPEADPEAEKPGETPQVVSLDAFRKRPPSKS